MKLAIDGMHCDACVRRVQKALAGVEGAQVEKVEIGAADVGIDSAREQAVLEAIQKAGYAAHKTG
jgi:copper chaperone